MSTPAGQLTITINADTAEAASRVEKFFHTFADNAEKLTGMSSFLEEFGKKIVAAFAIGSIAEFAKHAIEVEATLERMSQKSGITVGMLEGLRGEAVKNGLAFEELDAGLVMFADRIFQAVRHGGQFAEVFRDMKIALVEANGQLRPIDDILLEVARKFQAMPAGPQKAALAMELFGRSGRQFIQLLSMSTDELIAKMKEHGAEQERNAAQAEEFHKSLAGLTLEFQKMWANLANSLLPTLQKFVESLKNGVTWFQASIKEGGALSEVLKQIVMTMGAVAIAKAALNFSTVFNRAMFLNAGDLAYALGTILGDLRTMITLGPVAFATSPLVAFAASLTAIVELIRTGVEAWNYWQAAKKEALSGEKVKEQDTQLEVSLMRAIDAQEKSHTISAKIADIYRNAVRDAFKTSPDAIALHDRLTNLMRSLRTHTEESATKEAGHAVVGPSDQEIKQAEAHIASWLKVEAGANAISEEQNETLYKKRQISLETYFAVKKRLLEKSSQDEMTALQRDLALVDQQRHDPQNATNKEKQGELAIKREELLTKIIGLRQQLRAAEAKLSGDKWVEEQNNAKKTEEIELGRAEMRISHIKAEQALIQANPNLTDVEKARELIPLLKKENDEIEAQIELELKRQHTANLKADALLESQKKVEALRQQQGQLNLKQNETAGGLTFGGQFQAQFVGLVNAFGTVAQNVAKGWSNMVNSMRDSLATAIDDMIWKGERFKQAMGQFGLAILHSMVQSFAQITASWIMQHTVMAAWSSIWHAIELLKAGAHTTAQVGIHAAGEQAKTGWTLMGSLERGAIWLGETIYHALLTGFKVVAHIAGELAMTAATFIQSPLRRLQAFMEAQPYIFLAAVKAASAVADIPFVGPILAPIAAATTFAALEALAVFKEGGYTGDGDPNAPAGIVHKGEWVVPANIVSRVGKGNIQAMTMGRMPMASSPRAMVAPQNVGGGPIHVNIFDDGSKVADHMEKNPKVRHIVTTITGQVIHQFRR